MSRPRYALISSAPPSADLIDRMAASHPSTSSLRLTKRAEFFLEELLSAGRDGITTIHYPGVRVGDAIHKLRKAGVIIDTEYERHGGEFEGQHGRYRLRSRIVRLDVPTGAGIGAETEERANV